MSEYSLRKHKVISLNESDIFYKKYHFSLKIEKIDIEGKLKKVFCIDKINDDHKYEYELRSTKIVYTSATINNNEIRYNYNTIRNHIQNGDILYLFQHSLFGEPYYAEHFNTFKDFYTIILGYDIVNFTFVPLNVYIQLIQADYKEKITRNPVSQYKEVRQQWDITRPCLHCDYTFLISQGPAFRSKCCCDGRIIKQKLPQELLYLLHNELFQSNCYIYNNVLSFGSLGVDKEYDSAYIRTQGGSVTLQGRTYLLHRRENNTKALVFYTNGLKNNDEEDRIYSDMEKVVGPYNMNNDNTDECSPHIRIVDTLRREQFLVNNLAHEYTTIIENMQHMTYEQLRVVVNESLSVYDVSHYRSTDRGDPCMHVILKDSKGSHSLVHASNPYYEAVRNYIIIL